MKRYGLVTLIALAILTGIEQFSASWDVAEPSAAKTGTGTIARAYRTHAHDIRVQGTGTVVKVLADDTKGDRHQRFIIRLSSGQTLLIAHNIDIAPKIKGLHRGDSVDFNGVYEWDRKGGVVHWTHHDPSGRHASGWLKHDGSTYR